MQKTKEKIRKKVRKTKPLKKMGKSLKKTAAMLEKTAEIPVKKIRKKRKALKNQKRTAAMIQKKVKKAETPVKKVKIPMNTKKNIPVRRASRWSARILMILPILILTRRKAETTATEKEPAEENRMKRIRSSLMKKVRPERTTSQEKA